ncbi:MAG TPA: S8 family serine peptidase [Thermoanaerobaculia bacterium]|nr:S8 family serine peptidase [Thermoanaerobaculia bacterium]
MRKLFAVLLVCATPAFANEISYRSLQSGWLGFGTPIFDHGIHGEGQIISVLDTGLDWTSCYFAEPDNSRPPFNTGSPTIGRAWENIDLSRRKVIAYDFLYSCDQFPGAAYCSDPAEHPMYDYVERDHGTHAAASAAGDRGAPIVHDYGDAIAPGAKLIVQDAGLSPVDQCTARPGIGCPVDITPALDQAYKQGARIHSNSWGDYRSSTASYSQAARDIDAFVSTHPDMLVVFNTGNAGQGAPPASSLSSPGCAKNTLQVGGTRGTSGRDDGVVAGGLVGPARDGRIKPDVVGPAYVTAGDMDFDQNPATCDITPQPGTSWASPTIAGAAALVRQYYTDGFYPTGVTIPGNAFTPSAALLKATIIAAARRVPLRNFGIGPDVASQPTPSSEQGWGFPILDDALYFPGDTAKLRIVDTPPIRGLGQGESVQTQISVHAGTPFKAVLVWTDPAGVVRPASDTTAELVNDLDLRVTAPSGGLHFGNEAIHAGQRDRINNVETVLIDAPAAGTYTISVDATSITSGLRQGYALVLTGDFADVAPQVPVKRRAARH